MKRLLREPFAALLALCARGVLAKYHPIVVMVTGSVGKTSTKDAVAAALAPRFFLRKSEKSYNSEFGVPLTILGAQNPWASPVAWMRVFGEACALLLFTNHYPKLLVLEVGADRPGDLARIMRIATPDAVIVTRLPDIPVHVEAYANPEAVREEEFAPAYALSPGSPLVVSADDAHALAMAARLPVHVTTFGMHEGADVRLEDVHLYSEQHMPRGMEAKASICGETYPIKVMGALGRPQLFAPAAALALAESLGMSRSEALKGLENYVAPPGRMRLFPGRNGSLIIDDSYNASPAAVEEALAAVSSLPDAQRRIVVLGDMLELGRYSVIEHQKIGTLAAAHADMIVGIGVRSRAIIDAAQKAGIAETCTLWFESSTDAAAGLKDLVKEGDVVLVKGSQSIRTERVTEALLAHPEDVQFLVRQSKQWKHRP